VIRHIATIALAMLMAVGCSVTNSKIKTALATAEAVDTPVTCDSAQCAEYWQRAQVWLGKHSQWKLQIATDIMLQTYNPTNDNPSYGFSVLSEPIGGGRYRITVSANCGNAFGCNPKVEDVRRAFYHYVRTGRDLLDEAGSSGSGLQ
jgi:hypothetical protein